MGKPEKTEKTGRRGARAARYIEYMESRFPSCVTESLGEDGQITKRIDVERLLATLSCAAAGGEESYELNWVGKRAAYALANQPPCTSLRPRPELSRDWDTTENLYIEGENLEVLKLLQTSYFEAVKVIYIDPPYNTGEDRVYRDRRVAGRDEYEMRRGVTGEDEAGFYRLFINADTNGRFHSDWCSMMFSRLLLCRDLLAEDGVIFLSVDDHEQANLRKLCDEVFGERNFLAQIVWERAFSPVNLKKHFSVSHDYVLCYAKNQARAVCNCLPRGEEADSRYQNPDDDPRGPWTSGDLSVGPRVASRVYEITTPKGKTFLPPSGYCWRLSREAFEAYKADNRIWFGDGNTVPRVKRFLSEVKQGITPKTIWPGGEVGYSQDATRALKELFDQKAYFPNPKPVELIKRCIRLYGGEDCLVLDFFSGSATTAQAVMELNAGDGGRRRFLLVQMPEPFPEDSPARADGYENICQFARERIRRAGDKIRAAAQKTESAPPDTGFRVFRLDGTNREENRFTPDAYAQELLPGMVETVKPGRAALDLLTDCLLESGLPLSVSLRAETVEGRTVYVCGGGELIACFDEDVPPSVVEALARRRPARAVLRDSAFPDSAARINAVGTFRRLAPRAKLDIF